METTILVPQDGSRLAEQALPFASALARATDRRLILLNVTDPLHYDQLTDVQLEIQRAMLFAGGVRAEVRVRHVEHTEAARDILEAARELAAGLIVMATHGRGDLGRWLHGSVADTVLRRAEVPVVLVPAAGERAWPDDRPLRILVPLDGSPLAELALAPAVELAETVPASLILLRVVHGFARTSDERHVQAYRAEARMYLEGVRRRLPVTAEAVELYGADDPIETIIDAFAHQRDVDLIAMATHGHGGLIRALIGSVATGMLQRARVPLLLVRPVAARPPSSRSVEEHRAGAFVAERKPGPGGVERRA
jgi:nucleotide-binding universal stress UspA family protein